MPITPASSTQSTPVLEPRAKLRTCGPRSAHLFGPATTAVRTGVSGRGAAVPLPLASRSGAPRAHTSLKTVAGTQFAASLAGVHSDDSQRDTVAEPVQRAPLAFSGIVGARQAALEHRLFNGLGHDGIGADLRKSAAVLDLMFDALEKAAAVRSMPAQVQEARMLREQVRTQLKAAGRSLAGRPNSPDALDPSRLAFDHKLWSGHAETVARIGQCVQQTLGCAKNAWVQQTLGTMVREVAVPLAAARFGCSENVAWAQHIDSERVQQYLGRTDMPLHLGCGPLGVLALKIEDAFRVFRQVPADLPDAAALDGPAAPPASRGALGDRGAQPVGSRIDPSPARDERRDVPADEPAETARREPVDKGSSGAHGYASGANATNSPTHVYIKCTFGDRTTIVTGGAHDPAPSTDGSSQTRPHARERAGSRRSPWDRPETGSSVVGARRSDTGTLVAVTTADGVVQTDAPPRDTARAPVRIDRGSSPVDLDAALSDGNDSRADGSSSPLANAPRASGTGAQRPDEVPHRAPSATEPGVGDAKPDERCDCGSESATNVRPRWPLPNSVYPVLTNNGRQIDPHMTRKRPVPPHWTRVSIPMQSHAVVSGQTPPLASAGGNAAAAGRRAVTWPKVSATNRVWLSLDGLRISPQHKHAVRPPQDDGLVDSADTPWSAQRTPLARPTSPDATRARTELPASGETQADGNALQPARETP
ncbi:hypothetical protein [Burkholderia ambifaria]|uniref:hypothetical protein n=1 Tax=Burkholderia ambifaria TaxID=152480 RepID=UPI001592A912|nr:hypothetical protein [Burkholderia ambifaria]